MAQSPIFIDLETQSAANLASIGTTRYLRDPSTRLMSAAALCDGRMILWIPPGRSPCLDGLSFADLWPTGFAPLPLDVYDSEEVPEPLAGGNRTFVAHNAYGFDARAWRAFGYCEPAQWIDTIPRCRAAGLPAKLDRLGERFQGRGKDSTGHDSMMLLTRAKVNKAGRVVYPVGTVQVWRNLLRYNIVDVLLLRTVYEATEISATEARVLAVDQAINRRGIPLHLPLAHHVLELWHQWQKKATDSLAELTEGEITEDNVRSVKQVTAWFERKGLKLNSLERKQLEAFFADPDGEGDWGEWLGERDDRATAMMVAALQLRQQSVRATKGKVERAIASVDSDDRVRNVLVYSGAHTGRWTGRALQPHNMPKGVSDKRFKIGDLLADYHAGSLSLERVIESARQCEQTPDAVLTSLFRPIVCASPGKLFCIADYAGIEMRGTAWQSQEPGLLASLNDPTADPYKDMASKIFGIPVSEVSSYQRYVGKETVLGSGYGMGANKFSAMCKLRSPPVDLAKAGTSAEACIKIYRSTYTRIVAAWKWLQLSCLSSFPHPKRAYWQSKLASMDTVHACRFEIFRDALAMILPSGRPLMYRDARMETYPPGEEFVRACMASGMPEHLARRPVPQVVFQHPRGYPARLYGGCLMENLVQAMCRDLLADSLIKLEEASIETVLHVHDEIVIEVPEDRAADSLATLCSIMSKGPEWAIGFPIKVEGFCGRHYTKSPVKGFPTCTAVGGIANVE